MISKLVSFWPIFKFLSLLKDCSDLEDCKKTKSEDHLFQTLYIFVMTPCISIKWLDKNIKKYCVFTQIVFYFFSYDLCDLILNNDFPTLLTVVADLERNDYIHNFSEFLSHLILIFTHNQFHGQRFQFIESWYLFLHW